MKTIAIMLLCGAIAFAAPLAVHRYGIPEALVLPLICSGIVALIAALWLELKGER